MNSELHVNSRLRAADVVAGLLLAERRTALVTRCRPLNMEEETQRLVADWRSGVRSEPRFRYAEPTDLSRVRSDLLALVGQLDGVPWADLYRARARELVLETELAEAVGSGDIVHLSRQRYQLPFHPAPAAQLVGEWRNAEPSIEGSLVRSDDLADSRSLLRRVQAWVGRERLPFRVEVSTDLVSLAATGEGFIVVAANRQLTAEDAERVAVHEVFGHARPRVRARSENLGLFAAGSAGGNDAQEGYAVYCEQSAGVLHPARKLELAHRHLACAGVWAGLRFSDNVETLVAAGAPLELALRVCLRAYRGGGLAREGAYLPAYCDVSRAIAADPEIATWLGAGRLDLETINQLRAAGHRLSGSTSHP